MIDDIGAGLISLVLLGMLLLLYVLVSVPVEEAYRLMPLLKPWISSLFYLLFLVAVGMVTVGVWTGNFAWVWPAASLMMLVMLLSTLFSFFPEPLAS